VISWATILYGAAVTAALTAAGLALILRERRTVVLVVAAAASAAGALAWNAVLRATGGSGFFTDAPIAVFPVSWQDTGSSVFALAVSSLVLGLWVLRNDRAHEVITRSALSAGVALAVDVYLY
jgi:hypothetical protein